jgi:phosphatidate cytidylyltransferase
MLRRTITALSLLFIGLPAVMLGGPFIFAVVAVLLVGAAWEYARMFKAVGSCPNESLMLAGVFAILAVRSFVPELALPVLAGLVLLAMTVHVLDYERGRDTAALDFSVTLGGMVYVGWMGAYLLDLRSMPDGAWYFMIVLPIIWLADSGAYAIGAAYGRHKMTPRLSPKKSWEGYWTGVLTGALAGAFLVFAYERFGSLASPMMPWQGALLGVVLGAVTPLGDLGESMFKRQARMKDSSEVFPGHGGYFDRIDSWIWAAPIGYFIISRMIL